LAISNGKPILTALILINTIAITPAAFGPIEATLPEGSEVKARPRVIAVETHGVYSTSTRTVKELLEELGYAVEEWGITEPRVSEE
jgi:hypothetical protein